MYPEFTFADKIVPVTYPLHDGHAVLQGVRADAEALQRKLQQQGSTPTEWFESLGNEWNHDDAAMLLALQTADGAALTPHEGFLADCYFPPGWRR